MASSDTLYNAHRPRGFDAVVGQDHAVRILTNAIRREKVAHAYLLVGSRGSGKTTLARLLACAVNAPGGPAADFDPTLGAAPRILAGTSLELVVEVNCAQNNGIDDVREMQRAASLAPVEGARKVFILDEVHAMSNAAHSALLKLLEEPPPNVMFVLCTTDPDKLLGTTDSRCQTIQLRRPGVGEVARALRTIAEREQIQITDGALRLCARAGAAGFRDAIGELEKVATATDGPVDERAASDALGVVGDEIASKLTAAIISGDGAALLQGVEELTLAGLNIAKAADALIGWLRLIYLLQYTGEIRPDDHPGAEHASALAEQAEQLTLAETLPCVDWLAAAQKDIKTGVEPRIAVEVALLRCAEREAQLPARVARLERAAA